MRSGNYKRAVMALKNDSVILGMAATIPLGERGKLVGISGEPRYDFVRVALTTYQERGGKLGTHISGPAEAVLELLNERATREEL